MNKWQALDAFWNSFGIPAYEENSIPDDAKMPYITYNASIDSLDRPQNCTADVWYHSNSWQGISLKVDEISNAITIGGKVMPIDDKQFVWICRGTPFAQRMADEDDEVKRIYIVLNVEFLTKN